MEGLTPPDMLTGNPLGEGDTQGMVIRVGLADQLIEEGIKVKILGISSYHNPFNNRFCWLSDRFCIGSNFRAEKIDIQQWS